MIISNKLLLVDFVVAVVLFINGVFELRFVGTHNDYDKIKDCSEI